jgi:hypothetical protein
VVELEGCGGRAHRGDCSLRLTAGDGHAFDAHGGHGTRAAEHQVCRVDEAGRILPSWN